MILLGAAKGTEDQVNLPHFKGDIGFRAAALGTLQGSMKGSNEDKLKVYNSLVHILVVSLYRGFTLSASRARNSGLAECGGSVLCRP